MSKPKTLVRNSDKSYSHVNARGWKIYSVNHPAVPKSITSVTTRKGWIAFDSNKYDLESLCHTGIIYAQDLTDMVNLLGMQKVTVKNIMTGEMMEESLTLPYSCSVASESFWSA